MKCYLVKLLAREYESRSVGHIFSGWQRYLLEDDPLLSILRGKKEFSVTEAPAPAWLVANLTAEREEKVEEDPEPEHDEDEDNKEPDDPLSLSDIGLDDVTVAALGDNDIDSVEEVDDLLSGCPDEESQIQALTQLTGIGESRATQIVVALKER